MVDKKHVAHNLRNLLFFVLVCVAGILLQLLVFLNNKVRVSQKDFEVKHANFVYWSRVVTQYPNIPDILYDAALSAYNIGKIGEATNYLNRAIELDPLFKKAQDLKREIVGD